jgi:hypothetical protein
MWDLFRAENCVPQRVSKHTVAILYAKAALPSAVLLSSVRDVV